MKKYNYIPLHEILGTGSVHYKIGIMINSDIKTVWDNVCKCEKVKKYFTTDARRDLDKGGEVLWVWGDDGVIINVIEVLPTDKFTFEWNGHSVDYRVKTEFTFEKKEKNVLVQIKESGWDLNDRGVRSALANCNGWSDFLNALKIYTEHKISYLNK